jgi:hypothetical protein
VDADVVIMRDDGAMLPFEIRKCTQGPRRYRFWQGRDRKHWTISVEEGAKVEIQYTADRFMYPRTYTTQGLVWPGQLVIIPEDHGLDYGPGAYVNPRLIEIAQPLCQSGRGPMWLEMKLLNSDLVALRMTVQECKVPLRWHLEGLIQGVLHADGRPIGYTVFRSSHWNDVPKVLSPRFTAVEVNQ